MQTTLYLDTTAAVWMDSNGNLFADNAPAITIGSTQEIGIVLVTASPNRGTSAATPSAWPRDTSWTTGEAGATVTGMLTIDNDYLHRNKGNFSGAAPSAGATSVSATFSSLATYELAASGVMTLIETDGGTQAVGYNSFSYNSATGVYTFLLGGTVPAPSTGGAFVACAVPQPPLCQAFAEADYTNLSAGTIGFSFVADSGRLRELTEYASVAGVGINGLELLLYKQTGDVVEPLRAFTLNTATLRNPMGDPGYEADPPEPVQNMINAAVEAAMGGQYVKQMVYVTDSVTTNATIALTGGTHWTFEQPLTGLTFSSVENSHYESEIVFTAGTAFPASDPVLPVNVSVIGELSIEAGKKYLLNIRDAALVCGEFTVVGMDFTRGVWFWDDNGDLDTTDYHGQTSLGIVELNGGTILVNADSTVSTIQGQNIYAITTAGIVTTIDTSGYVNGCDINIIAGTVGTVSMDCTETAYVSGTAFISGLTATNDSDSGGPGASVSISGGTVARLVMEQTNESDTPMDLTISAGTVGLALITQTGISNGTISATISESATVINLED